VTGGSIGPFGPLGREDDGVDVLGVVDVVEIGFVGLGLALGGCGERRDGGGDGYDGVSLESREGGMLKREG
jgi:hypothetical protein